METLKHEKGCGMKRRLPKDVRYAPNAIIARLWLRKGKRRVRRLERQQAKRDIRITEDRE